jgi:hypothetical protein
VQEKAYRGKQACGQRRRRQEEEEEEEEEQQQQQHNNSIIIIIIIIAQNQGTTENSHIGHCTHTAESANVKVTQHISRAK